MTSLVTPEHRLLELLQLAEERDHAGEHPAHLMTHMTAPDERTGETFGFPLDDEDSGWYWQHDTLDWWWREQRTIALKARQLGVTWLGCGYVLWTALYKQGSLNLIYRQKEEEAQENVRRCWSLLHSLPAHLWNNAEIIKPIKGALPSDEIRLRYPNGAISRIMAMTSASASGHGKTAATVLLDEFSRIDRAVEIMKAVQPAAGAQGKIIIISTANGVSDPESGAGNHFHWLWDNAAEIGFQKRFLPWSLHPDRDQEWYDTNPEIRGLKTHERAEQYPGDEYEAFTLTNRVFFDPDDLMHYREHVQEPLYQYDFRKAAGGARRKKTDRGCIRCYQEPVEEHRYAIGADVATGRGLDYSAAYVIDLTSYALVAELHGRIDADQYAMQLHYLGRLYNTALLAVETGGGFGEAVLVPLRDGRAGRPAYPNLYRHILSSRPDLPISKPYGFPTNLKTRPLILNQLEQAIRERHLPYVTDQLFKEMRTFINADNNPSPRAQQGSRDDCVMAAAITLEMYRLRGHHPERQKRKTRRERRTLRPWQTAA